MNLDTARAVTDFSGFAALKAQARENSAEAVDEVAQQFEGLFIHMMLKRMRAASFGGGLLDSQQSLFYRDMHDQQLASHIASKGGIGLAESIKRQLGANPTPTATVAPDEVQRVERAVSRALTEGLAPQDSVAGTGPATSNAQGSRSTISSPEGFVRELWSAAEQAAGELGVEPEALLAQAALETGWGKHVMRHSDDRSSHNLFGIKADRRWDGDRVRKTTLEYKDGVALKTRADFRAYDSYEQAFGDYVDFVKSNPRYRHAIAAVGDPQAYFAELQKAGYATDPAYARKITGILDGPQLQTAVKALKTAAPRPI